MNSSSYLKFPELEQLKISFCFYNEYHCPYLGPDCWFKDFQKIIDIKSLNKLKFLFRGDISLFLSLENNSLEKAYISSYTANFNDAELLEKNMIKKFIDIISLKEIKFSLYYIKSNTLKSIKGENTSVKKLIIDFHKYLFSDDNNDDLLNNVQKKFPNITELEMKIRKMLFLMNY
jgi:hypothetical protein